MDYLGFLNLYQGGSKEYLLASVLGGVPIWDQDVPLLVNSKKKKVLPNDRHSKDKYF